MAENLSEGAKSPAFTLPRDGGGKVALKDFSGHPLILYFYPKDDTSGCTKESQGFSASASQVKKLNGAIVGVSKDSVASHDKFKTKYDLDIILASDENGGVLEKFGVWVEKSMYGRKYMGIERSTFLIDGEGVIRKVWRKVKVPGHVEEVMRELKALRN
jgi:peroxiredoxin Q/BCP